MVGGGGGDTKGMEFIGDALNGRIREGVGIRRGGPNSEFRRGFREMNREEERRRSEEGIEVSSSWKQHFMDNGYLFLNADERKCSGLLKNIYSKMSGKWSF